MPASFGVQGPGERTTASYSAAITASAVVSSLRTTSTALHQGPEQVDQVPGEGIVVVDDEEAGHRAVGRARPTLSRRSSEGQARAGIDGRHGFRRPV